MVKGIPRERHATDAHAAYDSALGANKGTPVEGAIIGPITVEGNFDLLRINSVKNISLDGARTAIQQLLAKTTSPYSKLLLQTALSVAGHDAGVSVASRYGTWDYDTQVIHAKK